MFKQVQQVKVKYNEKNLTGDQLDAIDKFSERFYDILQENKVHIE